MLYIDDDIYGFDLDEGLALLSPQRREQALMMRHELGRRQSVAAYLLLCRALREEYGITEQPVFRYGEHGKPYLIGHPEIFFSLSHCRTAVACAVADRPVGVDVESLREYHQSVVAYAMSDVEQQMINEAPQPEVMFIRLWTIKEARLKVTGEGIGDRMKEVLCWQEGRLVPQGYDYATTERLEKGYICTVCTESV